MAKGKNPMWEKADSVIPKTRRIASAKWQKSYALFITGQALVDDVTLVADQMEAKWGAGRLRMLVGAELRDKFDRQRYLFNQAIWFGELEDVRTQSARMAKAWNALDKAASDLGREPKPADVWDVISPQGNVYVIGRNADEAKAYQRDSERPARVFSLEEVCQILDAQSFVNAVKDHFQEAEIVDYQPRAIGDVLDDVDSHLKKLDDKLDDEMPF